MTNREILERRKTIEREKRDASTRYGEQRREHVRLAGENQRAQDALTQARLEIGRGILGVPDIRVLTNEATEAQERAREAKLQCDATAEFQKQLDHRLNVCLAAYFPVFRQVAEKTASKEAEEKIAEARKAIDTARLYWGRAQRAWSPLVVAVNTDDLRRHPHIRNGIPDFPITVASVPCLPPSLITVVEDAEAT